MPRRFTIAATLSALVAACGSSGKTTEDRSPAPVGYGAPVLLWDRGGCITPACDTGWYGSPAVADLDGNGAPEIVWGAYHVQALDPADGATLWSRGSAARLFSSVAIVPGAPPRIVAGRGDGTLTVYDADGATLASRTPFPASGELRGVAVADLDGAGAPRIVAGRAAASESALVTVTDLAGEVLPGWPQPAAGTPGFAWGLFNHNLAVAPLVAGGEPRILAGVDVHYVLGLDRSGAPLPAAAAFGAGKVWGQIAAYLDPALELQGFGDCTTSPRANFAVSPPSVADLDGDGTPEIVIVGDAYLCREGDVYESVANVPFVLAADRSRWKAGAHDWTTVPVPEDGAPRSLDYERIEQAVPNPVLADLDGDGRREILYAGYDGRVHAWWLDRTEHGSWPYDVPGDGIRLASEPAVVDLDDDGKAEVIFGSWPEKSGAGVGKLHVLDHEGRPVHEVDLPPSFPAGSWNGALGAPTVANVDANPDVEVLVGTAHAGVVAYRIPGSDRARILWGTGRGNFQRTGTP